MKRHAWSIVWVAAVLFAACAAANGAEYRAFPAQQVTVTSVRDNGISVVDARHNSLELKLASRRIPVVKTNHQIGTIKDVTAGQNALIVTGDEDPRTTVWAIVLLAPDAVPDWTNLIREERDVTVDSADTTHETMRAHSFRLRNAGQFYTSAAVVLSKDGVIGNEDMIHSSQNVTLVWTVVDGKSILLVVRVT